MSEGPRNESGAPLFHGKSIVVLAFADTRCAADNTARLRIRAGAEDQRDLDADALTYSEGTAFRRSASAGADARIADAGCLHITDGDFRRNSDFRLHADGFIDYRRAIGRSLCIRRVCGFAATDC